MVSWNLIRPGHTAEALIDVDRQRETHTLAR
jgi:hypothetical protein